MKFPKILAAVLLAGSTTLAAAVPASAAPLSRDSGLSSAADGNVTNVQWRGRHGHWHGGGRWHGHRHHHGWRRGGGWGPAIGGLAAGAIIGGAIASSQAQAAANADAVAYCSQRYRSYDPASGTYLNNDGNRYPCP